MRKIINFTHATLDGYIDNPHEWSFPYSNEELQDYLLTMHLDADALLLGRITYEGMAQAWPTRSGDPFSDHVNSITKYVVAGRSRCAHPPRRGFGVIAHAYSGDERRRIERHSHSLAQQSPSRSKATKEVSEEPA